MTIQPAISYSGQPISQNVPHSVVIQSGGVWPVPQGQFLLKIDYQSAIQWYDYDSGLWRNLDGFSPGSWTEVSSDGTNYRVINLSGTIRGVKITAAGTNYTQANISAAFGAPVAPGVTAQATPIVGGSLSAVVTNGGVGYTNPILQVSEPYPNFAGTQGLGIPAKAHLTVVSGVITAVTFDFAGAGYGKIPTYKITDPTGTGAVLTFSLAGAGTVTGLIMTNPGAGYDGTHIPSVTITDALAVGSGATGTALPSFSLKSVTVAGTNTGYSGTPVGETSLGVVSTTINDEPVQARPARVVFVLSAGIINSTTIEDPGQGFQSVPVMSQLVNAGSNATFTPVVGGINNTLIYQQVG